MSDANIPSGEAHLKASLDALGERLDGALNDWRNAEVEKRAEIEKSIETLKAGQAEMQERLKEERQYHLPGVEAATSSHQKDAFSVGRAVRAIATHNWAGAEYEKEVFQQVSKTAMDTGESSGAATGGYIIPEEALTSVINKLVAKSVSFRLGAQELAAAHTPLTIPRVGTATTAAWVAENAAITDNHMVFEQISLTPHTLASRVILSNTLLETSLPAADQVIETDMATQLQLGLDKGVLEGSGSSGQPTGIVETSGVTTQTATDGGITYEELVDFVAAVRDDNGLDGSLGWAMNPKMLTQIQTIKSDGFQPDSSGGAATVTEGSGHQMSRIVISEAAPTMVLGYPYEVTTQLSGDAGSGVGQKSMIFGNWNDVMVARWGGMRILASSTSDDAFSKDQTHIRGTLRVDVGVRQPLSFCVAS